MQRYEDDDRPLSPRLSMPYRSPWWSSRRTALVALLLATGVVLLSFKPIAHEKAVASAQGLRQYIHEWTEDRALDDASPDDNDEMDTLMHLQDDVLPDTCQGYEDILHDYGLSNIKRSRRYEGSGARIQRLLEKARRGDVVRVAVLGGSVSTGHGAIPGVGKHQYGAIAPKDRWHRFVVDWFDGVSGVKTVFIDGAKPAVDSGFFEWCWTELIGTDADLVMIETAVNDEVSEELRRSSETLLRSVMSMPQQPAVMYVDSFATRSSSGRDGLRDGGDLHGPLAAFYDVPHISLRAPLLPHLMFNSSLKQPYFLGDGRHIAKPLHRALGRLVVSYLQDELCTLDQQVAADESVADELWPAPDLLGTVPSHRMTDELESKTPLNNATPPPRCLQSGSTLSPIEPTEFWSLVTWKDSKFYIESKKVERPVAFEITLGPNAVGQIALSFLKSWEYGLGRAECKVDGQSRVLDGHWSRRTSLAQTRIIATGLKAGTTYRVECRILRPRPIDEERHSFRIMGLMAV